MTEPYVDDPDFKLYVGDVREVLGQLPDGSVDCCVTSPPYWGLRDYGTGEWDGGEPGCEHSVGGQVEDSKAKGAITTGQRPGVDASRCRKCGATRVDRQIGLEGTPAEYVAELVAVFREVRRVLADHGTLWLNLGDSYAQDSKWGGSSSSKNEIKQGYARPQERGRSGLKGKDLVGIPWRVAFALQDDGWYLRSDIIWAKPNPMPESVTDRPTKAHEYVFMLSKQPSYFFDQEAVREAYVTTRPPGSAIAETDHYGTVDGNGNRGLTGHLADVKARLAAEATNPDQMLLDPSLPPEAPRGPDGRRKTAHDHATGSSHENHAQIGDGRERWPTPSGRNVRSVWEIATQPYSEAHFATFPEALPRRCIAAGCPEQVCATCGKPRERILERSSIPDATAKGSRFDRGKTGARDGGDRTQEGDRTLMVAAGWSDCGHDDYRPGVVLDPFSGAATTALVARKLGRHAVGVELNPEYAALAAARLSQQSLFAE